MKRKILKIILITLMILLTFSLVISVDASMSATIKGNFNGSTNPEGSKPIIQIISAVLGVVRTAGAAVAVIILMTIAAKYIMASAGDRADIKKYAVNYAIGAIILFGTTGILGVVKSFVDTSIK